MNEKRFAMFVAAVLIVMAAVSRVVPHPWNFTPMIAVALFGGARIEKAWVAIALIVATLVASDLAMGLFPYGGMEWVYGSMIAVVLVGRAARGGVARAIVGALAAGALFFVVTNFGVWIAGGLYPRTAQGLIDCYVAAVPFYRNQIVGDLIFTGALFGAHAIATGAYARIARPQAA